MKKLITMFALIFMFGCSDDVPKDVPKDILKNVPKDQLVERGGVYYEINSSTPFNGTSLRYYDNGQLKFKRNYIEGKRDGLQLEYHENGQLFFEEFYKDGEVNGIVEYYLDNGKLMSRVWYKDGKIEGVHTPD